MFRRLLLVTVSWMFAAGMVKAEVSDGVIKIGVLSDFSGPYAEIGGTGSVLAARMAVEDFGAARKGMRVEIVSADHQNKPEVEAEIARRWYDAEGVDVIVDVPTSSVALAVHEITRAKGKAFLASGPGSSDLTSKACSPNTVHWTYDTWALANGTGSVIVLTGGKKWTFLTADYAFGHALQRDTEAAVVSAGGQRVDNIVHPFPNADLTPFLRKALATDAAIIGLANAGSDTTNAIKKGAEMGMARLGKRFAGLLVFITDVHTLGLETAQGLLLTSAFYWDLNDKTREWSQRFFREQQRMPTMVHAGVYSSVLHYLRAVEALGADDGTRVVAKMKQLLANDPLFGVGRIRRDGRKIHRLYLFEVKKPSESKGPWDYYRLRGIIPADTAFRSEREGGCRLGR